MEPGIKYEAALLEAAETKSEALRLDRLSKRFYAACYLSASGTIAEREAKARTNPEFQKVEEQWLVAEQQANLAGAKAEAMKLRFEVWRTTEATERAKMNLR